MAKSFAQTPAPKPSAEVIRQFETRGAGQDTQTHIASKSQNPEPTAEPTKRLSLDIPVSWHKRFKRACVQHDRSMIGELLDYLKRRTIELERD